ncbi:MAG: CapA family protein [Anaerolineales bacterium]|nr:MAG: CapA family protein [Anaerolineales bacterium]
MSSIPSLEVVSQASSLSPEFDWQSGWIRFPLSQENGETHEWSLVVCGDWAPRFGLEQAIIENPLGFHGDLLPIMQEADLAMVNLECVLTDDDLQPIVKDGIAVQLPTSTIAGLSIVPFHLACLANNHTCDYGIEGLTKTQELLERHHIRSVGAGLCAKEAEKARFFQFGNTRLAVVNVAEGEEGRSLNGGPEVASLDLSRLRGQLSSLRTQADVLMVVVHAGREHLPVPAPYIQAIYHSLVDAGADLVVGHHPHVPQGIELYKGAPIAYSLGNFALLMGTPVEYRRLGYFLKARFRGSELSVLEIWPYRIGLDGLGLLAGQQLARFLLELEELSAFIANDGRLADVWNAYADSWFVSLGMQELADSIALLGGEALLVQSVLKASLNRFDGDGFAHRLARRAIWQGINWLDQRIRSEQLLTKSGRRTRMRRGASILRNRFDTLAHRELYLTALRRVMDGKLGPAPDWASKLLMDWKVFWMNGK